MGEAGRTDRLRVALVCPYSLDRPGGVQGQVVGLARSLIAVGHQATVIAPGAPDAPGRADPQVPLVRVGRARSLRANGSVAPVALSPAAAGRAWRAVEQGKFDVVHLHEPFAPVVGYWCLVRNARPLVGTFHRSGPTAWYGVLRPVARRLAGNLDVRCAVSEAARATAEAALGGRYEVLFNGIDRSYLQWTVPVPTVGPTVLFLGRHEERKGLDVLLQAWSKVAGPGVLWVAGDGPETSSLRGRFPASERVEWLGVLSEQDKIARLAAADVVCAPSLRGESFGMVLLEAMATRCAVVASDLDGYRAACGDHATLVPPGDVDALASALGDGLADAARGAGSSAPGRIKAALAYAEEHSMDRLAARYLDQYRVAMERRASRRPVA